MQNAPQGPARARDAVGAKLSLLDRARASRREIALALLLTACALGFSMAAYLSQPGVVTAPLQ